MKGWSKKNVVQPVPWMVSWFWYLSSVSQSVLGLLVELAFQTSRIASRRMSGSDGASASA